jgi:hypothetical protein
MADSKVKNRSAELMQEQSSCEIAANEDRWYEMEKKIAKNPDSFYNARIFYRREPGQHFTPPILKQAHIVMLTNIKKILEANATNYKIVISPLYDQKKLNPADLIRLQAIFGKDKVTDLSGVNEITENVRNYYEESHYRIPVAREIMDKYIYAK